MTILEKIVQHKKTEVAAAKAAVEEAALRKLPAFERDCFALRQSLLDPNKNGIIAEFKRASPSKGMINAEVSVAEVVQAYEAAGAAAVSVLTDQDFFGGSLADLAEARRHLEIPLLRKDFVVDRYQITEAKAYGADVILLIAACLSPLEVQDLSAYAQSIGLSVLLEVHQMDELDHHLVDTIDAVGVNNRNLHTFEVDIAHSIQLAARIPDRFLKVSESGLSDVETVVRLQKAGFSAFLMGEHFMKSTNPAEAIRAFSEQLASSRNLPIS